MCSLPLLYCLFLNAQWIIDPKVTFVSDEFYQLDGHGEDISVVFVSLIKKSKLLYLSIVKAKRYVPPNLTLTLRLQ